MMDGKTLSIGWLEKGQIKILENLKKAVDQGEDYFELLRTIRGQNSPMLKEFGGRLTPEAYQSVFFRVAQDIVERAGIAQGRALASEDLKMDPNMAFMSLAEAGKLIGLSRAAIHLALTKGNILGWRVGTIWIVDRSSVLKYAERHSCSGSK